MCAPRANAFCVLSRWGGVEQPHPIPADLSASAGLGWPAQHSQLHSLAALSTTIHRIKSVLKIVSGSKVTQLVGTALSSKGGHIIILRVAIFVMVHPRE